MAIMLSKLARLLNGRPEAVMELLINGGYLSDNGLMHRNSVLSLLQDTHASVTAAETVRYQEYFEVTGPQPTAGFQFLAMKMERLGYLSPLALAVHRGS